MLVSLIPQQLLVEVGVGAAASSAKVCQGLSSSEGSDWSRTRQRFPAPGLQEEFCSEPQAVTAVSISSRASPAGGVQAGGEMLALPAEQEGLCRLGAVQWELCGGPAPDGGQQAATCSISHCSRPGEIINSAVF